MGKNDITFSLHLTLDGKEHLVTEAAAAKEVQRAVDQSRTAYSSSIRVMDCSVRPQFVVLSVVCGAQSVSLLMRFSR